VHHARLRLYNFEAAFVRGEPVAVSDTPRKLAVP